MVAPLRRVACVLVLMLHTLIRPFRTIRENALETLSLFLLTSEQTESCLCSLAPCL